MLKLYNTLTRKKEVFRPIKRGFVGLYTCGPSVYDMPHIGNYRTYVFEDVLRRYLEYKGYRVRHVMNITDVETQAIIASKRKRLGLKKLVDEVTEIFFNDLKLLNIKRAHITPKATEHINDMVELIKRLLDKGLAYRVENGDIFYDISRFENYGGLSRLKLKEEMLNRRITQEDYEKHEAGDFILWRSWKKRDGDIFWNTALGKGRPGWHIECSAMSMRYLGEHFDIHTGGVDNIFAHHENEIAQSEGASGRKFVNYWLHSKHLIFEGKKMSKSLGNVLLLGNLLSRGYTPLGIRYFLLSTHYRRRLNFTFASLEKAERSVAELVEFKKSIQSVSRGESSEKISRLVEDTGKAFEEAMDDDLDVPRALSHIHDMIAEVKRLASKKKLGKRNAKEINSALSGFNRVLAIF